MDAIHYDYLSVTTCIRFSKGNRTVQNFEKGYQEL